MATSKFCEISFREGFAWRICDRAPVLKDTSNWSQEDQMVYEQGFQNGCLEASIHYPLPRTAHDVALVLRSQVEHLSSLQEFTKKEQASEG